MINFLSYNLWLAQLDLGSSVVGNIKKYQHLVSKCNFKANRATKYFFYQKTKKNEFKIHFPESSFVLKMEPFRTGYNLNDPYPITNGNTSIFF